MSPSRAHATRAEVVSTLAVVALVVLGVVALWPRGPEPTTPAPTTAAPSASTASDTDLAPLRAAAGLDPCPAASGAPAAGPLAGVTVPCLGAPGTVDLGAALAGRPALLNVWASWCAPCRAELPALAEYAARADAVPVIGVDVQDDPRSALALLRELGVTLPSVTDPDDALRGALAVPPALPISYVVRADGTVARVDPPTPFTSADEVAAAVERLGAGDR
jgi:thiol-disulfide isomerase/thioredoxin